MTDSTEKRVIELAGRRFELSYLPFSKNRIVVNAAQIALKAIRESLQPGGPPLRLTDIDYMYLAVFEAVSFADPKVTREEFDKWGMGLPELTTALMAVAFQTGVLVQAEGENGSKEVKAA